jgi:hypothetical protein
LQKVYKYGIIPWESTIRRIFCAVFKKRNGDSTVKIKSGFVLEEVGGSYIAVAVGEASAAFSSLVKLNGTGAFLWGLMEERDVTREELVEKIISTYEGVSREQALSDIIAFETKLRDGGIIE